MNIVTRNVGSQSNHQHLSSLGIASNLAKLLPTGTVLVFELLMPSFSNNGSCLAANKVLTYILLAACTLSCIVLSITDSFVGNTETEEKIYHGIATLKGFYVLNRDDDVSFNEEELKKFRITKRDLLHMLLQVAVFWVVALSNMDLQDCIIGGVPGGDWREVMANMPIGVGVVCSIFFLVFPTKRRGVGHSDMLPSVVDCTITTTSTSNQLPSSPKHEPISTSV